MEQLGHYEERLEGGEEWPAMRYQPHHLEDGEVLVQASMPGSTAAQWQGSVLCSWLILPQENMRTSLVRAATRDQMDVQELYRTGPTPH